MGASDSTGGSVSDNNIPSLHDSTPVLRIQHKCLRRNRKRKVNEVEVRASVHLESIRGVLESSESVTMMVTIGVVMVNRECWISGNDRRKSEF